MTSPPTAGDGADAPVTPERIRTALSARREFVRETEDGATGQHEGRMYEVSLVNSDVVVRQALPRIISHDSRRALVQLLNDWNRDRILPTLQLSEHTEGVAAPEAHDAATYLRVLQAAGLEVDAWETTYLHVLDPAGTQEDPILEWVRGTGLRPVIELLEDPARGIRVTARDGGPGIPDIDRAMGDGFSTYGGLGLGLPGVRRLMDEFALVSETDHGTTVTMTKWERTHDDG